MLKRGKQFFVLFFIFFLLFGTGCAGEEIKKNENANRIRALYDSLDRLKKDYEAKNSSDFFSDLSSSFPDPDLFRNKTLEVFSQANTVTLNLYLDHIVLETTSSSLMVRWEGEWTFSSGSPLKNGGSAILKFSNEPVPRLVEIQGINPFLPPAKEKRS